ncbi:MAG TPA: NAD(P)H-dependent oxidoreductase [Gammaproteobacteria bacterium]|jgi:NAD(P)H-dependent FMN reductase|nr:NAD(P)H-dependent oxidoreductase [Gammaproteobacteria bacterium]
MTTIVGISGSLRRGSLNASLLRAAEQVMPAGAELDLATIKGIGK